MYCKGQAGSVFLGLWLSMNLYGYGFMYCDKSPPCFVYNCFRYFLISFHAKFYVVQWIEYITKV